MATVPKATRVMATAILPTTTPATAIRGMVMAAATIGQPIAPPTMVVIDQPTVPPSTEAIGSPAALRSTALVGAEPLVRKHVAYASIKPVKAIDRTSSRTVGFSVGHGPV